MDAGFDSTILAELEELIEDDEPADLGRVSGLPAVLPLDQDERMKFQVGPGFKQRLVGAVIWKSDIESVQYAPHFTYTKMQIVIGNCGYFATGFSKCMPEDEWSARKGYAIAFKRAARKIVNDFVADLEGQEYDPHTLNGFGGYVDMLDALTNLLEYAPKQTTITVLT